MCATLSKAVNESQCKFVQANRKRKKTNIGLIFFSLKLQLHAELPSFTTSCATPSQELPYRHVLYLCRFLRPIPPFMGQCGDGEWDTSEECECAQGMDCKYALVNGSIMCGRPNFDLYKFNKRFQSC